MTRKCAIYLENSDHAYTPGQVITGRIECIFFSDKKVKAIRIKITGQANVAFWEYSGRKASNVTYTAKQNYLTKEMFLLKSDDHVMLVAGKHTYPFQFTLPKDLPSSLQANEYNVTYKIEASVDRPWKFDYTGESVFNVFSPIDLNCFENIHEPRQAAMDKTICSLCCKSGLIEVEVAVPRTGFALGEKIPIKCHIANSSSDSIEAMKFRLTKVIDYTAHSPHEKSKEDRQDLMKRAENGVGPRTDKNLNVHLEVPSGMEIPNLADCDIISAWYELGVEAVLPMPYVNLSLTFPIIIGHIPLMDGVQDE